MEIKIYKAKLADMELLMEWRIRVLREVFSLSETADTADLEQANRKYYERHLQDNSHTACFVQKTQTGEIVGCGGICYQEEMPSPDNQSGSCGYLMNIYTVPEYRGMGVGRKIVQFLIQDAKEYGTEKIYLESSEPARQLYEDIGFRELHDYMKL